MAQRADPGPRAPAGEYSFCCWNAENLFDDVDDPDDRDADENWFGRNPAIVAQKMANLAKALLLQAGGRGPDILALVEVENRHAAAMLQKALNDRLVEDQRPPELAYTTLIFRENKTGRRIAPAILSRLPGEVDESITFPPTRRIPPGETPRRLATLDRPREPLDQPPDRQDRRQARRLCRHPLRRRPPHRPLGRLPPLRRLQ